MLDERKLKRRASVAIQPTIGLLASSFSFIPGIGSKTEESLWNAGIFTWDDAFRKIDGVVGIRSKRELIKRSLTEACEASERADASFFALSLPKDEHWRLYERFRNKTVFLDIETTGLSKYYDCITVVGAFNGKSQTYFIKDNNLEDICNYLKNYEVIVTFNGTNFDIPFLKKQFPDIRIPPVHLDLRYLLRSVGRPGPLKIVEKQLGIERPGHLSELGGRDAVVMWRRFVDGDNNALETLLQYNAFDTANLSYLLDYCCAVKAQGISSGMQKAQYQLEIGESPLAPRFIQPTPPVRQPSPKILVEHKKNNIFRIETTEQRLRVDRSNIQKPDIKIKDLIRELSLNGYSAVSLGIDLSGSEKRPTGVCILKGNEAHLNTIFTDDDLLNLIKETKPSIISIDSPLSLPEGRCCSKDTCECRKIGIMRGCERTLKKRGVNVYPCLIPSMQSLTNRGMELSRKAKGLGFTVVESYPGAAQDIMGLARKRIDLAGLQIGLINMGIEVKAGRNEISHHEIDALTSALVGYFYLAGKYEALGNEEEGYLIVPSFQEPKGVGSTERKGVYG